MASLAAFHNHFLLYFINGTQNFKILSIAFLFRFREEILLTHWCILTGSVHSSKTFQSQQTKNFLHLWAWLLSWCFIAQYLKISYLCHHMFLTVAIPLLEALLQICSWFLINSYHCSPFCPLYWLEPVGFQYGFHSWEQIVMSSS
jgi:hypothetical protein